MTGEIAVFGSLNMDLVAKVERFPSPGETIKGKSLAEVPGGKGANQAVAASRLGGNVSMFGLLGEDGFGEDLLDNLKDYDVDTSYIGKRPGPSGVALIQVDKGGENQIVIIPGANGEVDEAYVDRCLDDLLSAEVLLLQLEIPLETTAYLLQKLGETTGDNPIVILDPAPAVDLDRLQLSSVDLLTPNKIELKGISSLGDEEKIISKLFDRGVGSLVVTRGEAGSTIVKRGSRKEIPAFSVNPVDTTAAGDAFVGGLAVALEEGNSLEAAVRFAGAAGAISTKGEGAQPSLPGRAKVEELLKRSSGKG